MVFFKIKNGEEKMKLKYIGESFGVDGLTNGKIYECLGEEEGLLKIIDDSNEYYLYSPTNPAPLDNSSKGGRWEIIEDNESSMLDRLINN